MYTLREVPGKGKGLVTIRMILMGTRILSELLLISKPSQASSYQQVDAITPDQQRALLYLHNLLSVGKSLDIVVENR